MSSVDYDDDNSSDFFEEKETPNYLDHTVWSFLNEADVETGNDGDSEDNDVPPNWHPRKSIDSCVSDVVPAVVQSSAPQVNPADHVYPIAYLVPWINRALAKGSGCVAFLCGATCSGKTSSAQLTAQHFKARAFVVSSDLQYGMTGKTARDAICASLAQYVSQLERARREPVAILYDGMHLLPEDTRDKLHLAFRAGIPLEHVGWFVADQYLDEEEEVQTLMKRQQQRFSRFWNTGSSSVQQGDAKIVPIDQVRAMVRKLRATFLTENKTLVKWDDAMLLKMISEADIGKPAPVSTGTGSRRGSAELSFGDLPSHIFMPPATWLPKDAVTPEVIAHPIPVPEPFMWVAQQPQVLATRGALFGVAPSLVPTPDTHALLEATSRSESMLSSTMGPSPGPSCGPSPADSPFSSIQSPMHSQDTSPSISPTTPGRKALFGHFAAGAVSAEPQAPSLSNILKANSIHSTRPLTPPRNPQSSPSPATLSAVAAIVSTLHHTLNLKNAQMAANGPGGVPPATPGSAASVAKPLAAGKSPPAKDQAGLPSKLPSELRRNSAPVGLMPYPPAPVCPDWQVPKEMQGLLPTPPQVIIRPEMYGVVGTTPEGSSQTDTPPPRPRIGKKQQQPPLPTTPVTPPSATAAQSPGQLMVPLPSSSPTAEQSPLLAKNAKMHRRHSTSQYVP